VSDGAQTKVAISAKNTAHAQEQTMPRSAPVTELPPVFAEEKGDNESVASLNRDGSRKWFIPPYVVPGVIVALVAVFAIARS